MTGKNRNRSVVTTGSQTFLEPVAYARSGPHVRRYRDLLDALERERGGPEAMDVAQREACRAYAGLAVHLEQIHTDMATGKPVDHEAMGQIGDRMERQARRMGPPVKRPALPTASRTRRLRVPSPASGSRIGFGDGWPQAVGEKA